MSIDKMVSRGEEIISILIYIRKVIKKSSKATLMGHLQQQKHRSLYTQTPYIAYKHINISQF